MTTRIELNQAGIRELLTSEALESVLRERAERIADAAGPGNVASVDHGQHRSRGYVVTATPAAQEAEARDRTLTRSIEAGR